MDLVTVKDLIEKKFTFVVQRHLLAEFSRAVEQRVIQLRAFALPRHYFASTFVDASGSPVNIEAAAIAFYYFLVQDFYEKRTTLLELECPDYEDEQAKSIAVYRLKHAIAEGSIAFSCRLGDTHHHLTVLSTSGFREILNRCVGSGDVFNVLSLTDRKYRCGEGEYDKGWQCGAQLFRGDNDKGEGQLTLVLSVQTRSARSAAYRVATVKVPPPPYEADDLPGDVTVKPVPLTTAQRMTMDPLPLPRNPKSVDLPAAISRGPVIVDGPAKAPQHAVLSADPGPGGKAADFRLTPKQVTAYQDRYCDVEDHFAQYFTFTLDAVNKCSTEPRSLRRAPVIEWQDATGNWQAGLTPLIGYDYNGDCTCEDNNLDFDKGMSHDMAVQCKLIVKGHAGRDNRARCRSHHSLPDPLQFRVRVQEESSESFHVMTMQFVNPSLDLDTAESVAKSWDIAHPLALFVFADNFEMQTRSFAACYPDEDGFAIRRSGTFFSVGLRYLYGLIKEYVKSKAGTSEETLTPAEVPLSDFDQISDDEEIRAVILVKYNEAEWGRPCPYAVKLTVKTPSSFAEGSCHLDLSRMKTPEVEGRKEWYCEEGVESTAQPKPPQPAAAPPKKTVSPPASSSPSAANGSVSAPSKQRQISYTLLVTEKLGEGSFGVVYKGFDNEQGQHVAIKELRGVSGADDAAAVNKALLDEFAIVTKLNHPNIVRVLSVSSTADTSAGDGIAARIVMEWMPSGSLEAILKRNGHRLHEGVVRRYAQEALKGLAYLHENGVVHRDIKPANLLVSADGTVRVADFGCSKFAATQASSSAKTYRMVGTPLYLAPECIEKSDYASASDIWAWAATVNELASGVCPWSHLIKPTASITSLLFQICTATPPNHHPVIAAHASQGLKGILEKCFSKTPGDRPTAAQLLTEAYFTAADAPKDAESIDAFQRAVVDPAVAKMKAASSAASSSTGSAPVSSGGSVGVTL